MYKISRWHVSKDKLNNGSLKLNKDVLKILKEYSVQEGFQFNSDFDCPDKGIYETRGYYVNGTMIFFHELRGDYCCSKHPEVKITMVTESEAKLKECAEKFNLPLEERL